MYSKNKSMHSGTYHNLTPPPGYDGNRLFTRQERSDGRDENFVVHTRPIYRGRDREQENSNINYGSSKDKEAAFTEPDCQDCNTASADPFPPFPGVEAFLDESEECWEEEMGDAAAVPESTPPACPSEEASCKAPRESTGKASRITLPEPLAGLLSSLEREDLLLIGLLILLSADKSVSAGDILLLLALLLITK